MNNKIKGIFNLMKGCIKLYEFLYDQHTDMNEDISNCSSYNSLLLDFMHFVDMSNEDSQE